MDKDRKIQIVAKQVSFSEAEYNAMMYISKLLFEERLKEAFDLRKLNYFGSKEFDLPRIQKVKKTFLNKLYEK
ncbi:MAG: hypothetical protein ABL929_08675 [Ferruginibacter sp.]|nr:hypothetical protein [Ferruginibacter sp.]